MSSLHQSNFSYISEGRTSATSSGIRIQVNCEVHYHVPFRFILFYLESTECPTKIILLSYDHLCPTIFQFGLLCWILVPCCVIVFVGCKSCLWSIWVCAYDRALQFGFHLYIVLVLPNPCACSKK